MAADKLASDTPDLATPARHPGDGGHAPPGLAPERGAPSLGRLGATLAAGSGLGVAARAATISSAHATIGTARLNRLVNPELGDDRRAPAMQPIESLPIGAVEALHAPAGGQPLGGDVRTRVEGTLQADLSGVRMHTGPEANAAAESLSARAFTWGNHVFLGPGQDPGDTRLIAHEAAHVVQQQHAPAIQRYTAGGGGALEQEARGAEYAAQQGAPFPVSGRTGAPAVQREGDSFIPEAIAAWLKDHLANVPGYPLLALVVGRDPITQQPVDRTPMAVVRAAAALIPGGGQLVENLTSSGAVQKAGDWFSGEVSKLGLDWATIKDLLLRAWHAVSITDLFSPAVAWERVAPILGPPIRRLAAFALAAKDKLLTFVFDGALALAGAGGQRVLALLGKVGDAFHVIVTDPVGFLSNLLAAVKGGFAKFLANIGEHLKRGLFDWLTGALGGAIQLPDKWDGHGVLSVVLQVLGVTYQHMRQRLVKLVGEPMVKGIETAVDVVRTILAGGLAAAWQQLLAFAGNVIDTVIDGIRDWAVTHVVQAAITKLVTMLNPVGAIVQAIITIYNTVMFFIERAQQIAALVEAIADSIANIAKGDIGAAVERVEATLARTVPVIISFLARLLGLGGVAEAVKGIIGKVQGIVDRAIDRLVAWVIAAAKAITGPALPRRDQDDRRAPAAQPPAATGGKGEPARLERDLTMAGSSHHLSVQMVEGRPTVMMASDPVHVLRKLLDAALPKAATNPEALAYLQQCSAIVDRVDHLLYEATVTKGIEAVRAHEKAQDDLGQLAVLLGRIGAELGIQSLATIALPVYFNFEPTAPTSKPDKVYGRALKMKARTDPSGEPSGWERLAGKASWDRGHLISSSVSGPDDPRNLVVMPKATNAAMRDRHESGLYTLVHAGAAVGPYYWMRGVVEYWQDSDSAEVGRASDFAKIVTITYGHANRHGNGWSDDGPALFVSEPYTVRLPLVSELEPSRIKK
jgi:Domain of unknown function (DUF4157)